MLGKPRILSLSPIRLINSIKHEHSCKILYIVVKLVLNAFLGKMFSKVICLIIADILITVELVKNHMYTNVHLKGICLPM